MSMSKPLIGVTLGSFIFVVGVFVVVTHCVCVGEGEHHFWCTFAAASQLAASVYEGAPHDLGSC
jgi:hypothetical protein